LPALSAPQGAPLSHLRLRRAPTRPERAASRSIGSRAQPTSSRGPPAPPSDQPESGTARSANRTVFGGSPSGTGRRGPTRPPGTGRRGPTRPLGPPRQLVGPGVSGVADGPSDRVSAPSHFPRSGHSVSSRPSLGSGRTLPAPADDLTGAPSWSAPRSRGVAAMMLATMDPVPRRRPAARGHRSSPRPRSGPARAGRASWPSRAIFARWRRGVAGAATMPHGAGGAAQGRGRDATWALWCVGGWGCAAPRRPA